MKINIEMLKYLKMESRVALLSSCNVAITIYKVGYIVISQCMIHNFVKV